MAKGKHAYLIMAHNQFELLGKLLECIDHEQNDIFLHIDQKADFDEAALASHLSVSKCYFTKRIKVTWGGYSQIAAELILLEKAVSIQHYDYYHLITGVDFPLKGIEEINEFFDKKVGLNFISLEKCSEKDMERVRYYYFFQDWLGEKIIGRILRKLTITIQKAMHIQRNQSITNWGIGTAYFDISDDVARYIVESKAKIKRMFKFTRCADEIFLQTMILNSPLDENRYMSTEPEHPYIQKTYLDVVRAVDWTRGVPFVYGEADYEMLLNSNCMFARKFDYIKSPEIIDRLYAHSKNCQ